MAKAKYNPSARHRARRYVLQALYQWEISRTPAIDLQIQFEVEYDLKKSDPDYFRQLVYGIIPNTELLDSIYVNFLERKFDEVQPIERSILRLATFELKECVEIPYRVIINEALKLAKTFGAQDSYKFINGVVDKVASKLRIQEVML